MSKIRSTNTKPEVVLRKELWRRGHRYRLYSKTLPGKPDIIFRKHKLAIFVDGTFWHGYNWSEKKTRIKKNRDYWIPKIERNIQKDNEVNEKLILLGYSVLRFWDFEIKNGLEDCIAKIEGEMG